MPNLAAVCDTCRRPFPSGIRVENGKNIGFAGCTAGPCPWCGGRHGVIPDGVFDMDAAGAVRLARALPTTRDDLLKLAGILRDADLPRGADTGPVLARIRAEVPGAGGLLAVLRDPAAQTVIGLLALLMAMLALIGVSSPEGQGGAPPTPAPGAPSLR